MAAGDSSSTLQDTPVGIDLLLNDFDVDGDTLSVVSTGPTAAGGTVVIEVDNTVTYTPPGGFTRADSFTYTATDGTLSSGVATVAVSVTTTPPPPPGLKVAFIGDSSVSPGAQAVLQLIRDEGADMVLAQGDLGYDERNPNSPLNWDSQINKVLGPNFPFFASIGNHDVWRWSAYEQLLVDRLARVAGANCLGVYGVNAACTYQGMFFILSGVGTMGTGHAAFITDQLSLDDSVWRICSWHKNQRAMQVGGKQDEVGWAPYEECRKGRAIIATGHEHSYHRTKTLSDMQSQTVDPNSPDPDLVRVDHGSTFAFVSRLGGRSIRDQERCLPTTSPYGCNGEWASIYTSDQRASFGALFIEFNLDDDAKNEVDPISWTGLGRN